VSSISRGHLGLGTMLHYGMLRQGTSIGSPCTLEKTPTAPNRDGVANMPEVRNVMYVHLQYTYCEQG
jgi:hypothetical protein